MKGTVQPGAVFDRRAAYAVACLPYVVLVILTILAPGFMEPIFAKPRALFDQPAGLVVLAVGIIWGAFAFVVIWATSSRSGLLIAQLFFTMPALFTMILTAPLILIIERLGSI